MPMLKIHLLQTLLWMCWVCFKVISIGFFILSSLCFKKDVIFKEPTIKTNDPKIIGIGHQTKDKWSIVNTISIGIKKLKIEFIGDKVVNLLDLGIFIIGYSIG
jgi:hypothetical protein